VSFNLVVDANMVLAALRGVRTRKRLMRLQGADVTLFLAEPMRQEVEEHLPRLIVRKLTAQGFGPEDIELGLASGQQLWKNLQTAFVILGEETYGSLEQMARRRVPHDPDDWPCVALALALGASLLTDNVRHLGRSGIGVWDSSTVDVLIDELEDALEQRKAEKI